MASERDDSDSEKKSKKKNASDIVKSASLYYLSSTDNPETLLVATTLKGDKQLPLMIKYN